MKMELLTVAKNIEKAKCPEDIFGDMSNGSTIMPVYRQLVMIVHPDHFHGQPKEESIARKAFEKLGELRSAAERKVKAGIYGKRNVKPPAPKKPFNPMVIEAKGKRFVLTDRIASGDICDIYQCTITNGHSDYPAVFKIVRQGSDNDLVENEAKILEKLYPPSASEEKFYRFFPKLMDSFIVRGPGYQRRVNVLPLLNAYHSLAEVLRVFPDGIDFRDMVWMFQRILHGIGFAHTNHIVHGAIIPPHILIHPIEHGAKIIDWSYAVNTQPTGIRPKGSYTLYDHLADDSFFMPSYVKAICSGYKNYYPPEILAKKPPTAATDIYMTAKCAIALVGGDVTTNMIPDAIPNKIQEFFKHCLLEKPSERPQDAWDAHEMLDKTLQSVLGKRRYRPFPMPKNI